MSLEQDLAKSSEVIENAIRTHKTAQVRTAMFGMGGITLVIGAIREFCKHWPEVKKILKEAIKFLRQRDREQLADILQAILSFFDAVARVCPFVP